MSDTALELAVRMAFSHGLRGTPLNVKDRWQNSGERFDCIIRAAKILAPLVDADPDIDLVVTAHDNIIELTQAWKTTETGSVDLVIDDRLSPEGLKWYPMDL